MMRIGFLLAAIFISAFGMVRAQLCDGEIRFGLFPSEEARRQNHPIAFAAIPTSVRYPDRLVSSDGMYEMAVENTGSHGGKPGFSIARNSTYITLEYGCTETFDLVIVRHTGPADPAVDDTMRIRHRNACDEHFGCGIPFQPGIYSLLVCDTARQQIVRDSSGRITRYRHRPLAEQYPSRIFGAFDMTASLERVLGPVRREEPLR